MTTKVTVTNDGETAVRFNGTLLKPGETHSGYVYQAQAVVITECHDKETKALDILKQIQEVLDATS